MGQVFTWEAIRSGKIPQLESFHTVGNRLRTQLATEPSVASALLFGSVVRGDFNFRSDIDCLVLYKTEQEGVAMAVIHEIDREAHGLHVPINFTPCDTVLAHTHLHHLGSSFVRHLQASIDAGGLIKGDLVGSLAPTISPEEEIRSYIKMKMYKMQASFAQMSSFSEEQLASFLKKAFEAPMHVARKMLIYESTLGGDSKKEVQARYRDTMPSPMAALFNNLLALDAWYSSEVERQARRPNRQRYNETLALIMSELSGLLQFLRLNILRLNLTAR